MERILAPSILAADIMRLGEQVEEVRQAGAKYLHIDVMDGVFVPSLSYGVCVVESIRKGCDMVLDVHLMIVEPERYIEAFAKAGADIITVHLEACVDVKDAISRIHSFGCRAGVTVKPGTPVEAVEEYLDSADLLLIMSVEPGFGGQKYFPEATERIRQAAELIKKSGRQLRLEVDGGITLDNVREVLDAGADVIVSGSAIFNDPGNNAAAFMKVLNRYGAE
ncbi:MAG: ribulose-phosphate 3-epimerase [Eubacteriales bacterium]|nr:ribulose-phosphate 3-epimerase [Eubacteriales bacterium]